MPQPQAPSRAVGCRGNSAMAQFKPKCWQVEDRCGICSIEFSILNARHHCRACGISVCSKHSKNKAIVPTSLSKVPQRVCDKCYPKCRTSATGLASPAPVRRQISSDRLQRHTLKSLDGERNAGGRIRIPVDGLNRDVEKERRDNRSRNGDDGTNDSLQMRREGDVRACRSSLDRRMMSPRAKFPHGLDPRQVVSSRGRPARDGDLHSNDLLQDRELRRKRDLREKERQNRKSRERDPRERDRQERDRRETKSQEKDSRERDPREKDRRERDPRERDRRDRDPRDRDRRERDRRDRDPRERDPRERDRRDRDPRERERRERDPRERDPRDRDPRDRDPRDRDPRDRDPRDRDPRERAPRDRDRREKDPRERVPRDRELREKDPRERERRRRDLREKDSRERERRERDPREKDLRERERRERDPREKDLRERERHDRALYERKLTDDAQREKPFCDPPGPKERRRVVTVGLAKNQINEQIRSTASNLVRQASGKHRVDTSSTCHNTSSALAGVYAGVTSSTDRIEASPLKLKSKRPPVDTEKEKQSAFADSTFSIFSLAGSDHSDSELKERNDKAQKLPVSKPRKDRSHNINRGSLEKKEHLDCSASSSSLTSFEVSAITQKYLNPPPAKTVMPKARFKPMTEDGSESEELSAEPSRRKMNPGSDTNERRRNVALSNRGKSGNRASGEAQKSGQALYPLQHGEPIKLSVRDSSEIQRKRDNTLAERKGATSKRTLVISEYNEFELTQYSISDKSLSDDNKEEDEASLLDASSREKQDLAAEVWAKKAAIAGIDPASLEATEKALTTANYKLTRKDQEIMQQISELEAVVLEHQNEVTYLLDMYHEATKRAQKAQKELQRAKVRVVRYEKAHARVIRAIRCGKMYMKQEEYMAAILELSRAIGIERSNATLWYLLAECRLKVSQPAAAEDACTTSLRLQPTNAALAMLGRIMHKRGRNDEAMKCYLLALGRNDESEDEDREH